MFAGNEIHSWWMKIAALTEERAQLLLSQMRRRRDEEDGEFLDVPLGRGPPGASAFLVKQKVRYLLLAVGAELEGKRFERPEGFSWIPGRMRKEAGKEELTGGLRTRGGWRPWIESCSKYFSRTSLCRKQLPGRGCRKGRQLDSILRLLKVLGDFSAWRGTLATICALFIV